MILLALGSNMGDRAAYLRRARELLEAADVQIVAASSVMETAALLPPDAPEAWNIPFLNQVLVVATGLSPEALLARAKLTEKTLGRQSRGRWGPREIDIDLLSYNQVRVNTSSLVLPHPGMLDREFVLKPLAEVAPEWRHPVLGKTAAELLR